jgi:hypothetical protein
MNRDKIIGKIKKCLALSASSNEHEAAAAMRQARKLMDEYHISDLDIQAAQVEERSAKSGVTLMPPQWESTLATRIAIAFGCRVIFVPGWSARRAEWRFVGCGAAAEVSQYALTVLLRQAKTARSEHIKTKLRRCKVSTKTRRADLFCEGWVRSVTGKIDHFAGTDEQAASVEAYIAVRYPELETFDSKDRNDGRKLSHNELGDYIAGDLSGRSAQLNRGVGGHAARPALGGAA